MANDILVRDGNNVSVMVHSIEDGTSVHYHLTVLADTSGHTASFVSGSQAAQATMRGFVVAFHPSSPLPAGTLHLGKVSLAGISDVSVQDNAPVSVRGGVLGAVSLGGGTALIGRVSIAGAVSLVGISDVSVQDNAPVSVRGGTLGSVSLGGGTALIGGVSVRGIVTVAGPVSLAGISDVSVQDNAPVSVRGGTLGSVSLGGSTALIGKVSVEGLTVGGGLTVSVGGAASVQAVPIAGRDSNSDVRQILTDISGTVKVGGYTNTPEYVFTRPADTTAYAIGDLVANNTTAGSVTPMSFPVSRLTGGGGSFMVRRARLIIPADNRTTDRNYRLHFFNAASGVSVANGDNGVFSPTLVSDYCGYIDIPMFLSASSGSAGIGTGEINITLGASQVSITTLLEARTSILPANAAVYRTILELVND